VRTRLGTDLELIEKDAYRFCWIVDFPMYEWNEEQKKIDFSHNPFSMPQGGLEALEKQDPVTIKAYQYDIVCNGVELSSGAIRNHDIMYRHCDRGYCRKTSSSASAGSERVSSARRTAGRRLTRRSSSSPTSRTSAR
jgi:hypothetical protein